MVENGRFQTGKARKKTIFSSNFPLRGNTANFSLGISGEILKIFPAGILAFFLYFT